MAGDRRQPRRGMMDPLVAGAEGAAAGYRAVEAVAVSLADSLRRSQDATFAAPPPSRARSRRAGTAGPAAAPARTTRVPHASRTGPGGADATSAVVEEIADLAADVLDRVGRAAQEIAHVIQDQALCEGPADGHMLRAEAAPGQCTPVDFWLTNTGSVALVDVSFEATDLIRATDRIEAAAVEMRPYGDDRPTRRIGPGGREKVSLEIMVPDDQPEGVYRGCIVARSTKRAGRPSAESELEGAWAVIELHVTPGYPYRAPHRSPAP